MQRERLAGLDFLRGFAALWVLLFHYVERVAPAYQGPLSRYVLHVGWNGVDLFFVLSGFLIGSILASNRQEGVGGFLVRRVFRIYPAYLVIVLVCLCFSRPELRHNSGLLLSHLFMVHNLTPGYGGAINGVLWTLGAEFQFYLLAALLLCLPQRRSLWWTLTLGMLLLSVAARYAAFHRYGSDAERFFHGTLLPGMLGLFAAGFAVVKLKPALQPRVERHFALFVATGAALLGVFLAWLQGYVGNYWDAEIPTVFGRLFSSLVFGYLVLVFACTPPAVGRFLRRSGWVFLGEISYGIYLTHLLVMEKMATLVARHSPDLPWFLYLAGVLALVMLGSTALYVCIEKPFIALGKRVAEGLFGRAAAREPVSATQLSRDQAETRSAP
ncbi:acyltransferase [Pseudomonas sp. RIT-PI-AD]|uniref:acyltransferase family protein n=1 Tax=Pseudomonas sp. RIT-PI-AD TaxID=3035294 RepID=UPI0021D82508|nr:acyltransferase [Pseudomonas sp. RIT-PI-AD]